MTNQLWWKDGLPKEGELFKEIHRTLIMEYWVKLGKENGEYSIITTMGLGLWFFWGFFFDWFVLLLYFAIAGIIAKGDNPIC